MPSRAEKQWPLPARRRKHHVPRLAWRGNRLARRRSVVTPNSGPVAHSKEAQKMTPCKNYLAETKPAAGFFARPRVTPCDAIPDPSRAACWPPPKRGLFQVRFLATPADAIHLYERHLPARITTSARPDGSASCPVADFHLKMARPRRDRAGLNWQAGCNANPSARIPLPGNQLERAEHHSREERPSCPSKSR